MRRRPKPGRLVIKDVTMNAFAEGLREPHFTPVTASGHPELELHISVRSPIESRQARSETDLLRQLWLVVDGLIFEKGARHGNFLPAVWRRLPSTGEYLAQLKTKASLAADCWSEAVSTCRYATGEL